MASVNQDEFNGLFDLGDDTASYLQERKRGDDGLYRPSLDKIRGDARKGYQALIRLLPNLQKDGKMGQTAQEKHIHYADFKDHQELSGYYDCRKNFEPQCELCNMYWALKKSGKPGDEEKAALISRNTKYYSYVLVIEDENQPDLVGKVLVWQYGFKIKEKIKSQYESRRACRVEDVSNGMNLELVIKDVGGYTNYDLSTFVEQGPITINGKQLTLDPKTGKVNAEGRAQVLDLLQNRTVDLDNYKATPWTDEVQTKVNKILAILSGSYTGSTGDVTYSGAGSTSRTASASDILGSTDAASPRPGATTAASADDVFDDNFLSSLDEV